MSLCINNLSIETWRENLVIIESLKFFSVKKLTVAAVSVGKAVEPSNAAVIMYLVQNAKTMHPVNLMVYLISTYKTIFEMFT